MADTWSLDTEYHPKLNLSGLYSQLTAKNKLDPGKSQNGRNWVKNHAQPLAYKYRYRSVQMDCVDINNNNNNTNVEAAYGDSGMHSGSHLEWLS